jgi:hypothetical protein
VQNGPAARRRNNDFGGAAARWTKELARLIQIEAVMGVPSVDALTPRANSGINLVISVVCQSRPTG